jgi:DNA-binding transcriptional ArsR family regulator
VSKQVPEPQYVWDIGTAYDMFSSLNVLHRPAAYGLRPAWAAGMRSRLPAADRAILEEVSEAYLLVPALGWIHSLPAPKDGATALSAIEKIPAADRLPAMYLSTAYGPDLTEILVAVKERGAWDESDVTALKEVFSGKPGVGHEAITQQLDWWVRAEEFGEYFLRALISYYEVFFEEEERRILPALEEAVEHAQDLAERLPWLDLVEALSQGVHYDALLDLLPKCPAGLVFAPSYWSTPLVSYSILPEERALIVFGARPSSASLVPGEVVPDMLLRVLKALSDPTRLRILRYLAEGPLTPGQLARRLRLRGPTVIHHLNTLRVATLVELSGVGKETTYAIRDETIPAMCAALEGFLDLEGE